MSLIKTIGGVIEQVGNFCFQIFYIVCSDIVDPRCVGRLDIIQRHVKQT